MKRKKAELEGLWRQEVAGKWVRYTDWEKAHTDEAMAHTLTLLTLSLSLSHTHTHTHTHADRQSSRAVECKQVSYGRECTISRSFPSPLQQALLYHTSAVSTASEDYWEREEGREWGRESGRDWANGWERRVECEIETCIAPMCPQNCDYYPVGIFFSFNPYSSWENITRT